MARDKAHTRYKIDGEAVPGATTVLGILAKPALVPWANKLGLLGVDVNKYVDDKAAIGTLAHAMVTDHYAGRKTETSDYSANQIDQAQNSVLSWWEWAKEHRIGDAILIETALTCPRYRYGGTPDLFVHVDDAKELLDLKTGSGIYPEHVYQVAAYKHLLEENGYMPVDRVRILNIPRTEDEAFLEKVVSEEELRIGWEIFVHCLAIHNLKKEGKSHERNR